MSTVGLNARIRTFAKVFINRCLRQFIPDQLILWCQQTCWIWHDVNSDVISSV